MNLIHSSIKLTEANDIETLKDDVAASVYLRLNKRDMDGFFGALCRYGFILGQQSGFYEFETGGAEKDWAIMKECFVNAGSLDSIVNFKYAVSRKNEGWRCISGRKSGIDYLWDFFEPERDMLMEIAQDIVQKEYEGVKQSRHNQEVWLDLFSRFDDWDQVIQKAHDLKKVK